jgi:NADH-quinone oxidoreductase subunit C
MGEQLVDLQQQAIDAIKTRFPEAFQGTGEHVGQKWMFIARDRIIEVLTALKNDHGFTMLMDLTAVDYLNKGMPERYCVVYQLFDMRNQCYVRVKTWVPEDDPVVDTASDVWKAAPWAEREVWDLFGISFRGHRDLRRIVLPFTYTGHPLRKDYPLRGKGERFQFQKYVR